MTTLASGTSDAVTKEYRFAVVMYGGVSLAIYMNGIAQELLSMVRATAVEDRAAPSSPMLGNLKGTEAIYRRLALLLSEEADGQVHVRFLIDIISGTSAGGINGVFLAKALTARKDMQSLKRTWLEEGNFQKLLNDSTHPDISLPRQIPPHALLSGERMYIKLFEAFAEMDHQPGQPYVDELNLWVTATDLLGKVVPLRLADRVVWERKYKQAFNLKYSEEDHINDFQPENTPFLAFVSRCTSSFPVAFEPMRLASIPRLLRFSSKFNAELYAAQLTIWQRFFGQPDPAVRDEERFYADGGYLDNRPFDHAIEGLMRQSSPTRSERKLLYIEPSPEHPERERLGENGEGKLIQPDALENAWDALAGIPGKQPIRDNLIRIQERNRLIAKVNAVIAEISGAIENSPVTTEALQLAASEIKPDPAKSALWKSAKERVGYRAYTALNVYAVTDDLAIRIARICGYDDTSDFVYAIRWLVREWRQKEYQGKELQFLLDFDISYRMRRFQFVKNQLQMVSRLDQKAKDRLIRLSVAVPETNAERQLFRQEIARLSALLDSSFRDIRTASRLGQNAEEIVSKIRALDIGEEDLNFILGVGRKAGDPANWAPLVVVDERDAANRASELLNDQRKSAMNELRDAIKSVYFDAMRQARKDVENAIRGEIDDPPVRQTVYRLARLYFYGFQEFDAAIFPITYGTDTGELDQVDVVRVSPEDATAIVDESKTGRHKLAGTAFGAFGAFLEEVWRMNDILWGRLDGAERIIRTLAPMKDAKELIDLAHDVILEEELKPANRAQICQMLVDALLRANSGGASSKDQRAKMIRDIEACVQTVNGSTDIDPKLVAVLQLSLTPDQLRCCLANFEMSREPNRKETLESIARSARILGMMLKDMSRTRTALNKPGGFLIQASNVLWGLVEVSIPGSIWGSFYSYWFGLLMLFSIVMILGGTLFSEPVQALGFRLLTLCLAVQLSVSTLHKFISGKKSWWRLLEGLFIVVLLIMLVLGFVELQRLMAGLDTVIGPLREKVHHLM